MSQFDEALRHMVGKRVYIDTNILIYFFNKEERYFPLVSRFLAQCAERKILGVVSELVMAEIMVEPYRGRNVGAIAQIRAFFGQPDFLHVSPHHSGFMGESAMLAGEHGMKLIDAMHFHTALANRCHFLITHDGNFKSSNTLAVVQLQTFTD